ncbi:MAG: hypothetical protein WA047_01560 [Phenylobacterium sp.]|uniref:hypothetical protein n=1 Tax=Phenylobacterium sp. TaxID=1871053 RepID=UPI003BB5EE5B
MTEYEDDLIGRLVLALQGFPGAVVDEVRHETLRRDHVDAIIHARIANRPVILIVETKKTAYPRDVRHSVWQLRKYLDGMTQSPEVAIVPLLAAQFLSAGAKDLLQDEGVGYYDGDGNLFVPAEGAYLYVEKPRSKAAGRKAEAVFSGKRARVVHAVWGAGDQWFKVHEIARRAQVSPGAASETLQELESREWVEVRGAGPAKLRRLADGQALLSAWRDHQLAGGSLIGTPFYVSAPDLERLTFRLDDVCRELGADYAVTGQMAGQAYAPHLTQISKLQCRIEPKFEAEVLSAIKARPVREGWNLTVLKTTDADSLLFRQRDGARWLADPLQTYLDLLRDSGRSQELAEHLRQERLSR